MNEDFRDLLAALLEAQARFLVVGAHAMAVHSITGVEFDDAWAGRVTHEASGLAVPFLGRAALVQNKRATGRAKDRADLEALGERA